MSNSKTSNGIIIPNLDTESRNTGSENTLLNKKKLRDNSFQIDEKLYQSQTVPLGNSASNKSKKERNDNVFALPLNEDSPPEALNSVKHKQSVNSDYKKLSSAQKHNIMNYQINEVINYHNPNLINKKSEAGSKETQNGNIIKIKNPNLISSNNNSHSQDISNYSSDPNFGKIINAKVNGKLNKTIVQDQSNFVNQKININKYNNNNEQLPSSNSISNFNNSNINKQFNQGVFNKNNSNNLNQNNMNNNNNFSAQQQMQIMNQFTSMGNANNPMQMMNKIAMNMQNQNNINFNNQSNPILQVNNISQQSFLNNNNLNLMNSNNPNQNMNKIVFPNPNAGMNQPAVKSQNKNLSFSSNFLHLLNKNYIEAKLSSLAHVKILNSVYRNAIIPVVPELFSKSSK